MGIDLSKQQALDTDPKAIQQIHFTRNLDRGGNTSMFFILEHIKETILDFSKIATILYFMNLLLFNIIFVSCSINVEWLSITVQTKNH